MNLRDGAAHCKSSISTQALLMIISVAQYVWLLHMIDVYIVR